MVSENSEDFLPLDEAAKYVQRTFGIKKPHVNTVHRWCLTGQRGVKLQSLKCGGPRVTRKEWIKEFFRQLADRPLHQAARELPTQAALRAEQRLIAQGI